MPLQLRIGLILLALTTFLSTLGYDPFASFIAGGGQYTLPSIVGCILLFMVGRRSQHLEQQLATAATHLHTAEAQRQTLCSRLDALSSETVQLLEQLASLRLTVAQQEVLAPARLLLAQGDHTEAVKLLQAAVEAHPDSVEINWLLGESMCQNKHYADALPHLLAGLPAGDVRRLSFVAQCEQTLGLYSEAEAHLNQLISAQGGEPKQEDLLTLGAVQRQLDPQRAKETLAQVLALNPYNSVARYQLIELETESGAYESAIDLATEGLERNTADVGCFVSRAEAYFRRGRREDEKRILDDLATAQARNRKDYNIYRLRGALQQRRAGHQRHPSERQQKLHQALVAYEDGLTNVPPKFHAHLLAAASRVLLQLRRFDEAAKCAQRAVNHYPGHVSNHLALAFSRLATRQWQAAAEAAERGLQWAGWGGRVWLTAIGIFANACGGMKTAALRPKCAALVADLKADDRQFALSESWDIVRGVLGEAVQGRPGPEAALVTDTIALLGKSMTLGQYVSRWVDVKEINTERDGVAARAARA
ncbi:MAG: tetratricopeptide repeat protein [bacterium]|nr:tetratricopeptide repeat protein [bacterium]